MCKTAYLELADSCPLTYVTPLPLAVPLPPEFSFSFSDQRSARGLVVPTMGYAFGGLRGNTRYADQKKPVWDCCGFIENLVESPCVLTTGDLLAPFLRQDPENGEESALSAFLRAQFFPVSPYTPRGDFDLSIIHTGDIYFHRSFGPEDPQMEGLGKGGHTAVVMGVRSNGNIVTMGCNRDMPMIEGLGLQEFIWTNTHPKKTYLLRKKS